MDAPGRTVDVDRMRSQRARREGHVNIVGEVPAVQPVRRLKRVDVYERHDRIARIDACSRAAVEDGIDHRRAGDCAASPGECKGEGRSAYLPFPRDQSVRVRLEGKHHGIEVRSQGVVVRTEAEPAASDVQTSFSEEACEVVDEESVLEIDMRSAAVDASGECPAPRHFVLSEEAGDRRDVPNVDGVPD